MLAQGLSVDELNIVLDGLMHAELRGNKQGLDRRCSIESKYQANEHRTSVRDDSGN